MFQIADAPGRAVSPLTADDGAHPSSVAILRRVDGVTRPTVILRTPHSALRIYPEFQSWARENGGRDSALRCPRPRPAGGMNDARADTRSGSVPRLNGAVTAQRAVPTNFGVRVYRAFSLVELLVVMTLLSLIVVALMAVFNTTQKAFRASVTQTDVLEGGRAAMDMMASDLRQMAPSYGANNTVNFCVTNYFGYPLLVQSLAGSGMDRTNAPENFFILSRGNINGSDNWIGTGYAVITNQPNGLYSLYRFSTNHSVMSYSPALVFSNDFVRNFLGAPTNYSHLLDGVVHLRLLAYDTNGMLIGTNRYNIQTSALPFRGIEIQPGPAQRSAWLMGWSFYSNALPASVEIEMGVLEDRALQRAATWPNGSLSQSNYLAQQAGKVHVFRQRVTIPNVDPSAYQ